MAYYRVRYVHKISPRESDIASIELPDGSFSDSKVLGKALRGACALCSGERVRSFRVEGEKVVVFPDRGIWHSLIIEPA